MLLGGEVVRGVEGLKGVRFDDVSEIRLRVDKPMIVRVGLREFRSGFYPGVLDVRDIVERIGQHSLYAFEAELRAGYITLPGGHRVGVCGQVVLDEGAVGGWRHIGGVNIRVARNIFGCADFVLPHVFDGNGFLHTMIISPPGFGKTTILRDIVRQVSDGGLQVGLVDERSEVAGCFQGVPQNDVGMRTDVIDGCPKHLAMVMLLRAMSPQVIAVDEIGGPDDARAVEMVLNAGVKLLCTAHGNSIEDAFANPGLAAMLQRGIFQRFVVLHGPGGKTRVYDGAGKPSAGAVYAGGVGHAV